MSATPALELERVSLARRGEPVLQGVDLVVAPNDFLAILGPNGSGKSTLLHVILGLLEPDAGRVRVLGGKPDDARGRIGYVPQYVRFDLDFPIRVVDVVLMGRLARRAIGRPFSSQDRAVARAMLDRLEIGALAARPIGQLSGGERQRVLIARALACEPELLLLDEPTASLDERIGRDLWALLQELSREMTLIMVTHDVSAVSQRVKRVACLNRQLYEHPSGELTPDLLEEAYGQPLTVLPHHHHHGKT